MARATMIHIIDFTKQLLGQDIDAESPFTTDRVQDVLDETVERFEWFLLDHDFDYLRYYCRPPSQRITENLVLLPDSVVAVDRQGDLTFSGWSRIAFIEGLSTPTSTFGAGGYEIRSGRGFSQGGEQLPSSHNLNNAQFVYTSSVNEELYIYANAFNPYKAAVILLMENPDMGIMPLKRQSMLGDSEEYAIEEKLRFLTARARSINTKQRRLVRS